MAFAIQGQTKATAAVKGNFGIYGPIWFTLYVEVAYWRPGTTCYMAFAIKGQTKATAAVKGNFGIYGPIWTKTSSYGAGASGVGPVGPGGASLCYMCPHIQTNKMSLW